MIAAESVPDTLATRAAELFTAYRGGDDQQMGALVALLTPILWHTVRSQRVDQGPAEDVVQSTWLALVRSRDSINEPQAVLQWLLVTARREAWRAVKRSDSVAPTDFDDDDVVAPERERPEQLAVQGDVAGRLWQHIAELPARCQALLRVIAFADRPDYAAVAEAIGMPVGSIGPTRGRCLAKLRRQLADDPGWDNQ